MTPAFPGIYRIALLHSGGNARGGLALPVLRHLERTRGHRRYAAFACVSVGTVNGPEFAAGKLDELEQLYSEVDGINWYLKMQWPWQWWSTGGIYTVDKLRSKIAKRGSRLSDLPGGVPVYSGVYDYQEDCYVSVDSRLCASEADWLDARVASMAIPFAMSGWKLKAVDGHLCFDGGLRNVIPELPAWDTYDEIDVILCSPIGRSDKRGQDELNNMLELLGRTVDVAIDNVVIEDLRRLQRWADAGVKINLYAPRWAGKSFDATRETMELRYTEGEWMVENPILLGPQPGAVRLFNEHGEALA